MSRAALGGQYLGNDRKGRPMAAGNRLQIARDCYRAYETGERELIEQHLAADYTFYSPADPGIDRARYFERCWPNARNITAFEYRRLVEVGDEVLVTYESTRNDGMARLVERGRAGRVAGLHHRRHLDLGLPGHEDHRRHDPQRRGFLRLRVRRRRRQLL